MKFRVMLVAALCFYSEQFFAFKNLQEVTQYSVNHAEYPDNDTNDWLNPVYDSFFKSMCPGIFKRVLARVGIVSLPFRHAEFTGRIESILRREASQENKTVVSLDMAKNELKQMVIIGDLFGSLHSFSRIFDDLLAHGIINDQFIISPGSHILFLGDFMGPSPYGLELLSVIVSLYEQNPTRMTILRGKYEDRQRWLLGTLGHELQYKVGLIGASLENSVQKIEAFFQSLPRAAFIVSRERSILCLSNDSFDELTDQEFKNCANQLFQDLLKKCSGQELTRDLPLCNAQVIISTKKSWDTIRPTLPLEYKKLRDGIGPLWELISGQTRTYRQVYRCRWEGYGLFKGFDEKQQGLLEYWGRRIDYDDQFSLRDMYNIVTGEPVVADKK